MTEKRYLDEDGLTRYSQRIINYINSAKTNSIKSVAGYDGKIYFFNEPTVPTTAGGLVVETAKAQFSIDMSSLAVDIVDNLDSIEDDKALSAKQGYELNQKIQDLVVDNLTSTDTDKALSANKGKYLYDNMIKVTSGTTDIGEGAALDPNSFYIVY